MQDIYRLSEADLILSEYIQGAAHRTALNDLGRYLYLIRGLPISYVASWSVGLSDITYSRASMGYKQQLEALQASANGKQYDSSVSGILLVQSLVRQLAGLDFKHNQEAKKTAGQIKEALNWTTLSTLYDDVLLVEYETSYN